MRIVVHDYAGHPNEVYMSRELARRGHEVLHLYAGSIETPRGELVKTPRDAPTFDVEGVFHTKPFLKHTYVRRQLQEVEYGRLLVKRIAKFKPDVVLSGNTPLFPQARLLRHCRRWGAAFVFWVEDVYGLAVDSALRRKFPGIGHLVGGYYIRLEKKLLLRSDKIVVISEGFLPAIESWGVPTSNIEVVPLWPPLDDLPVVQKENDWSRRHGFDRTVNLIYAGTLGTKHNPESLVALAEHFRRRGDIRIIVISEGVGIRYLQKRIAETGLTNLILMPYQPYEQLPQVMGAADVLLALLEASAGQFSVPGKILSHLCAARPTVAAVPLVNRAAKVIEESGGGLAVPVGDDQQFVDAVQRLVADDNLRQKMGRRAREYAETAFDIRKIAKRFEEILESACQKSA
ncbi:MAG TPA: glycosyltransferase family 4 protein, partial [Lacipirellulaceae bacterium]|nr:glycosyltransferase family 4 protein [Lacipirellulaceae bacterium]